MVTPITGSVSASPRITVFAGAAAGSSPDYRRAAVSLSESIVGAGFGIVYGGSRAGLMGAVADAALAAGGEVIGVMPRALVKREIAHNTLSRFEVVADMHARKRRMAELGSAFIALPGGLGTLEELFEVWTWQKLGLHHKPVALYNVDGYWDALSALLDTMTAQGFVSPRGRRSLIMSRSPAALLNRVQSWCPTSR